MLRWDLDYVAQTLCNSVAVTLPSNVRTCFSAHYRGFNSRHCGTHWRCITEVQFMALCLDWGISQVIMISSLNLSALVATLSWTTLWFQQLLTCYDYYPFTLHVPWTNNHIATDFANPEKELVHDRQTDYSCKCLHDSALEMPTFHIEERMTI